MNEFSIDLLFSKSKIHLSRLDISLDVLFDQLKKESKGLMEYEQLFSTEHFHLIKQINSMNEKLNSMNEIIKEFQKNRVVEFIKRRPNRFSFSKAFSPWDDKEIKHE